MQTQSELNQSAHLAKAADHPHLEPRPSHPTIKYVAEVAPVKEVTLHGLAELSFWRERLKSEELEPIARDDQAQLFISATEARFGGIQFRECIIGVQVQRTKGPAADLPAIYLVHAWNSLRAFAWIERNLFGTPYYPGQIIVNPQRPAQLQLAERGTVHITAQMNPSARDPAEIAEENWHGAIFLPRRSQRPQQLFIAKLAGRTEHFPFDSGDQFQLTPSPQCPAIGWLLDSHFTPHAWHIRQAAAHAKSKTYRANQFI